MEYFALQHGFIRQIRYLSLSEDVWHSLPALTKDSVGKGNIMSGFERYSQDQFPFREAFRKLKTKALFSLYQQKDVHGFMLQTACEHQ